MSDPMDRPPKDHGNDRYDYIEVEAPDGIMPVLVANSPYYSACPDCRSNVFFKLVPEGEHHLRDMNDHCWHITIAHDETCPTGTALGADDG